MAVRDGRDEWRKRRFYQKPRQQAAGRQSFAVIHQDDDILCVAKPGDMLVNMGRDDELTLQHHVRKHVPRSKAKDAVDASAVHRLDRHMSGLVLFGRTQRALEALHEMIRRGEIEKYYAVLTCGVPREREGEIDAPLEEHGEVRGRRVRVSDDDDAMEALTHYKVEERWGDIALLNVRIFTGRSHQIRVHLAHINCPVAGDKVYGDKAGNRYLREKMSLDRQFLHAKRLVFTHPFTGKRMDLTAKLPKELANVLKKLGDTEKANQK